MTVMTMRIASPLHVGNGNELTPIDIYPGEGLVHVIDIGKLVNDLTGLDVSFSEIIHLLKNPQGDAYIWKGYMDEFHMKPSNYALYSMKVHGELGSRSMRIKDFIKQNGRPYVPGSSVKGAIRTAVLYKVLKECEDSTMAIDIVSRVRINQRSAQEKIKRLARDIGRGENLIDFYVRHLTQRPQGRHADDLLNAMVFGMEPNKYQGIKYEPKRDPLKGLTVRDSNEVGRKHLAVYHVDVIGNQQSIPIWVEALEPGTTTEVEVIVDEELLRLNAGEFNGLLWECLRDRGEPWRVFENFLWEAVDEFYEDIIKAELNGLKKFGTWSGNVRKFYSFLKDYSGHLLRLGWGSGWLTMTVGLLLMREGYKWEIMRKRMGLGKKPKSSTFSSDFPKTRRLADGTPMGWVVVQ